MKIEKGMYVRNHLGRIEKIQTLEPYNDKQCINNHKFSNNVIKASHNIIDLIEVGDYVNGYYVEDVKETFINIATGSNYFQSPSISEEDVKTIVTKQQFESMQYEVK